MNALRDHKFLVLFLTLVAMLGLLPLAHGNRAGLVVCDALGVVVALAAFLVVFEGRLQRGVALAAASVAIASNWAAYALRGEALTAAELAHHAALLLFLVFAVVVILRGIFRHPVIRGDDVIGGLCGYLLAGTAWANLYLLTEVALPGSFSVRPEVAWQLTDRNLRHFLFHFFSFVTLTSMGSGDVTPARPTTSWLVCLEAVFGQFYIAVVVAQMVGLKLAQAGRARQGQPPDRPPDQEVG